MAYLSAPVDSKQARLYEDDDHEANEAMELGFSSKRQHVEESYGRAPSAFERNDLTAFLPVQADGQDNKHAVSDDEVDDLVSPMSNMSLEIVAMATGAPTVNNPEVDPEAEDA